MRAENTQTENIFPATAAASAEEKRNRIVVMVMRYTSTDQLHIGEMQQQ
jgi:hypothetical protein